jgi:DNA-binding transcriptional LysR family regulator
MNSTPHQGYLERFGTPQHPTDLKVHRCLRLKLGDGRIYQWEFARGDETLVVDAPGTIALDEAGAAMSFVRGGVGLLYVAEPMIAADLTNGDLQIVLRDWSIVGPGFLHVLCQPTPRSGRAPPLDRSHSGHATAGIVIGPNAHFAPFDGVIRINRPAALSVMTQRVPSGPSFT